MMTTKTFRITLPLVVEQEFDSDFFDLDDMVEIKEQLGELLDMLLISTDYLHDYWKAAQVEEV
jgi:hypothetical protein